jgi:flagellar basal-body rod modification protein FlgD
MSINLESIAGSTVGATEAAADNSQGLGKDDFLNLLIAQLSNQNPLEPMDGSDFVAQLAQFSSVEQLTQINDGLELLALGQAGLITAQTINLVGKTVSFPGGEVNLEAGKGVELEYEISRPASSVDVVIKDSQGRSVKTMELGITASGSHKIDWDGLDDDGDVVPPGTYTVEVEAIDADGTAISVDLFSVGRVTAIHFEQGIPYIMVGDIEVIASDIVEIRE